MAVLESIRSKAGTIVVIVIGLALFSFVMQDLFSSGNSIFNSRDTDIGEINGETVKGEEFQRRLLSTLDDVTFIQNGFLIAKVQEPENKMKVFGKENNYVQDILIGTTIYLSSLDDPVQQIFQIT